MPGQRKFLYCTTCKAEKWAQLKRRYIFECEDCSGEINLIEAKKKRRAERKAARVLKQKQNGTYKSQAVLKQEKREKRGEIINLEYMEWIKKRPCMVPGCTDKNIDAHHSVHRSQGRDDRTCVPLCHHHHIVEYHGKLGSVEMFEKNYGLNLIDEAKNLWSMFQIVQGAKKGWK